MFVFVILSGSKRSSNENAEPSESEEAEKAKAIDADSSNDLKALFGQQTSTSSPLPTKHDSTQKVPSSKQSSKGQTVTTMPISSKTGENPNRSFLEVSLGDIKPSAPEQNQMSSAVDVVGPSGTFKPSVLDDDDNGSKVGKNIAQSLLICLVGKYSKAVLCYTVFRLVSTMIAVSPNNRKYRICYLVKIAFVFDLVTFGEN